MKVTGCVLGRLSRKAWPRALNRFEPGMVGFWIGMLSHYSTSHSPIYTDGFFVLLLMHILSDSFQLMHTSNLKQITSYHLVFNDFMIAFLETDLFKYYLKLIHYMARDWTIAIFQTYIFFIIKWKVKRSKLVLYSQIFF